MARLQRIPGTSPVYHYREDRIRAHVQLCWLALLLIRVAETTTGDTWCNLRHELDRMHLVTLVTAEGRVAQRATTTSAQKSILDALQLPEPPKYLTSPLRPAEPIPAGHSRRAVTRSESRLPAFAKVNAQIRELVCS
jgi:hypothetical protein